ncbi:hypothetical protein HK405_008257 [Cladochytrium tenue]|nr:hypothetical protein HK405_008257 [Cladochytrium tenue]
MTTGGCGGCGGDAGVAAPEAVADDADDAWIDAADRWDATMTARAEGEEDMYVKKGEAEPAAGEWRRREYNEAGAKRAGAAAAEREKVAAGAAAAVDTRGVIPEAAAKAKDACVPERGEDGI